MYRKVIGKELKVGMFIADIDRPWIDTPFLLQGFLIEDEGQLIQVRDCCQWVLIDPQRSIGEEYSWPVKKAPVPRRDLGTEPRLAMTRVEEPSTLNNSDFASSDAKPSAKSMANKARSAEAAEEAAALKESDVGVATRVTVGGNASFSDDTKDSVQATGGYRKRNTANSKGFFGQIRESFSNLFVRKQKDVYEDDQFDDIYSKPKSDARPSFIPETMQLIVYENKKTVEEEMSFATEAFARTNELLDTVVGDIRTGNRLSLENVEGVIEDVVDSMVRNPDAMMWVARMREQNSSTYSHSLHVAINLVAFGRYLGYPKESLSRLGMLGLLLDVGKIKLPQSLLAKTASLSPEEFELLKTHVALGIEALHKTPNIHADVLEGIAQHHERMNGTGYPNALIGEKISIFGRMAAIADTYSAMTESRPYAEQVSPHEALQMLSNWSGTQFHPDMVEQFIQSIGAFPVGSLVELSTGEVAVVATHNKLKRLKPKVLVVTEADKTPRKHPRTLDLIYDVSEKPVYIRRGLPSNSYGLDATEFYLS